MAYESHYWRKVIRREVTYLNKKLQLTHKDIEDNLGEHFSNVEIKIMTLAYVARKLADSNKLPDSTLHETIKLKIHPRTSSPRRPFVDIEKEMILITQQIQLSK